MKKVIIPLEDYEQMKTTIKELEDKVAQKTIEVFPDEFRQLVEFNKFLMLFTQCFICFTFLYTLP